MKAYSLLVEEPEDQKSDGSSDSTITSTCCDHNHSDCVGNEESCSSGTLVKEKGFIPSLYAGIRRCSPNNHIHVDQRTDYIMGLILAAEPELLGKWVNLNIRVLYRGCLFLSLIRTFLLFQSPWKARQNSGNCSRRGASMRGTVSLRESASHSVASAGRTNYLPTTSSRCH